MEDRSQEAAYKCRTSRSGKTCSFHKYPVLDEMSREQPSTTDAMEIDYTRPPRPGQQDHHQGYQLVHAHFTQDHLEIEEEVQLNESSEGHDKSQHLPPSPHSKTSATI